MWRDTDESAFVCFVLICDYSRRYVYLTCTVDGVG